MENRLRPIHPEVLMILTKRHYLMIGGSVLLAAALTLAATTLPDRSDPVTLRRTRPFA